MMLFQIVGLIASQSIERVSKSLNQTPLKVRHYQIEGDSDKVTRPASLSSTRHNVVSS